MSKVLAALALLVVAALASEPTLSGEAELSRAELDEALGSDETCGTSGEEAALCALNALQLKVDKLAAEGGDQEQGACDSGMVGKIKGMAPGCLESCQQMCGPLGQAINAFMRSRQAGAKKVVCANTGSFACAYDHWGSCATLVHKAAGMGFNLPHSKGALYSECR